jgi:anti-sigma-K factor RskA
MNQHDMNPETRGCGGDLAAYALGALDPAEVQSFEAHLAGCAICRDELAAFQAVVNELPTSVPAVPAPKRLRRQVMAAVAAEPKRGREVAPSRRAWGLPWNGLNSRVGLAMAAVAAVVVVAAGVLALGGQSGGTRVINAQVLGSTGTAQIRLSSDHAELVVHKLAPPPAGHIYEVWLKRSGRPPTPTSALFSVTSHGDGDVEVPGSLRGISQMMVTPEPAGGSPVPTHSPIILATLT